MKAAVANSQSYGCFLTSPQNIPLLQSRIYKRMHLLMYFKFLVFVTIFTIISNATTDSARTALSSY